MRLKNLFLRPKHHFERPKQRFGRLKRCFGRPKRRFGRPDVWPKKIFESMFGVIYLAIAAPVIAILIVV